MSLSKQIIFATDKEVAQSLAEGAELNVVDEYGYTPLIQTAIVDSESKAKLLLDAGAEVDFADLTTRTALHWAASNGNYALCKLFLQHGANPNAYTNAGQNVLVMPYLRKQKNIRKALVNQGAKLDFAKDFVNAKLLGHRFELQGRADIIDHQGTFIEVELEGFYLEFNLEIVRQSLADFRSNFGAKHLRKYFSKLDAIMGSLQAAIDLIKYQHYLVEVDEYAKRIDSLLAYEPLILPVSYDGHAITFIKMGEWLVRCDRGEFGRKNGTVIFYYMRNAQLFTKAFIKQLLYKRQSRHFIDKGLIKQLGLEVKLQLPLSPQRAGNCSWANVEAVVPAAMLLLDIEAQGRSNMASLEESAMQFYNEWVEWDRKRELHFCLESFYVSDPARKASKAALLAAVLFQACSYDNAEDQEKVARILPILTQPEYSYILQSYHKVFGQDRNNPYMNNLRNFLDDFGVSDFRS
ncbi:MAG: ankyrin repeat domain-containing protein [Gammaproteobacteria bacterium]|nr:ankyrin repeat domain-containing protein [Gammaproteobacteria bacterium]